MVKKICIILMLIIIILDLCGCYDSHEIDDYIHVLVIGIDEGVTDKWRLTLQFSTVKQNPGSGGGEEEGGGGGGGDNYTHITVDAPSFFSGVDMLNASVSRKLIFSHTGLIIISEGMAKDGVLGELIAPLVRFRQIRKSTRLVVAKGKASDFIKNNKPFIGTTLSKGIEMIAQESAHIGYFGNTTLNEFYNDLKSTYSQPTITIGAVNDFKNFKEEGPKIKDEFKISGQYKAGELPRKGDIKIEYWGTAVFKKDKMIAELDGGETRTLLILRGDFSRGVFTIQDPEVPELIIPLDIRLGEKPKIKIHLGEGEEETTIDIKVSLKGDILAVQSRLHYEVNPLLTRLEKTFEKEIKRRMDQLINKCKNLNVDIFKFGNIVTKKFWTIQDLEKYNWNENFKDVKVNTQVKFTIERTGTRVKSSPLSGTEEEE